MLTRLRKLPLLRGKSAGIVDVETALAAFRAGKMLIVTDSEDREHDARSGEFYGEIRAWPHLRPGDRRARKRTQPAADGKAQ